MLLPSDNYLPELGSVSVTIDRFPDATLREALANVFAFDFGVT